MRQQSTSCDANDAWQAMNPEFRPTAIKEKQKRLGFGAHFADCFRIKVLTKRE